jgi:hypothetical protein
MVAQHYQNEAAGTAVLCLGHFDWEFPPLRISPLLPSQTSVSGPSKHFSGEEQTAGM